MKRVRVITSGGRKSPGSRPVSPRIPSTFPPPLSLLPSIFSASRPASPLSTEAPPPLLSSVPTIPRHGADLTPISSQRLATDPPRDLTGQITRKDNEFPVSGGYGCVWRGSWQNGTKTCKVAIKVLRFDNDKREKLLRRLRKEIEVWKRLDHKNIVPLLGTTSDFGSYSSTGMVSPWMDNGNLTTYLKTSLTLPERLRLMCDVANGLAYLHSNSVIHGDLTGSNILIDHNGTARLVDFGLSTIKPEFDSTSYNSSTIGGALRWLSPELLPVSGKARILSPASDIYSLGSVILQVLSGKVPYHYLRDYFVVLEIHNGRPPRRPEEPWVTDTHWELINRCWNKDPCARPSIREVKDRVIGLHRASVEIVSEAQRVFIAESSSDRSPLRHIGSPLFQPSPLNQPHQTHSRNSVMAQLTPTSRSSPILNLSSFLPISTTLDRTAPGPSTLKLQPNSLEVHDRPGNTASLDFCVEPSRSTILTNDKLAQHFPSNTQSSSPINNLIKPRKRHSQYDILNQRYNPPSEGPNPARSGQSNFDKALPLLPISTTNEYCLSGDPHHMHQTNGSCAQVVPHPSINLPTDGYESDFENLPASKSSRAHATPRHSVVGSRREEISHVARPISLSLEDTIRSHRKMAALAIRLQTPPHQ